MRLRRTYYRYPYTKPPTGGTTHVEPALGGFEWVSRPVGSHPDYHTDSVIQDVAGDNWKYHDCLHYKGRLDCGATDYFGFPCGGYITTRLGNAAFCVAESMDVRPILSRMPNFDVYTSDRTDWFYNQFFSLNGLPTVVPIDRDPFDSRFSIWMLLVDLLDARHLGNQFAQLLSISAAKGMATNQTVKALADAGLLYQFGVVPTARDAQDFGEVLARLTNMDMELANICDKQERHRIPATRQSEELLSQLFPDEVIASYDAYTSLGDVVPVRARITHPKREYHRTVRYGFSMPEIRGWTARFRQFVETLGILDPSALWDAIPFSFVVDWFYNVSNWLHRNRPPVYRFDVKIDDYCESIVVDRRIDFTASWDEPRFGVFSDPSLAFIHRQDGILGSVTVRHYVRRRFDPRYLAVVSPSSLPDKDNRWTLRRLMIGSALVAQRIPRMRARR